MSLTTTATPVVVPTNLGDATLSVTIGQKDAEKERVRREFLNITNNHAYVKCFTERVMRPCPSDQRKSVYDVFLGNNQRLLFLPHLDQVASKLAAGARVTDLGGGAGEIFDICPSLSRLPSAEVFVEEPNGELIQQYRKRLAQRPDLRMSGAYECFLQDLYQPSRTAPRVHGPQPGSQDLVLALHMIYFLSDVNDIAAGRGNPKEELLASLEYMCSLLQPGGSVFLVYADLERGIAGYVARYHFEQVGRQDMSDALSLLYKTRNQVLRDGISDTLRQLQERLGHGIELRSDVHSLSSSFFAPTRYDLAVTGLIADLLHSNEGPFNIQLVDHAFDWMDSTQQAAECVSLEDRPDCSQYGLWKAPEPQVAVIITRTK